ncbi:MAG: prepilin peptidase [Acidimicrobiia bacterium]|nr:prepilin peptidase [Acidimicrobiia bacterium]
MVITPEASVLALVCAVVSLPAGWFAGVLATRVPDRENLVRPWPGWRPDEHQLVISLTTTALFVACGWRFADQPLPYLLGALALVVGLVPLAVVDIRVQRLPDAIVAPLYVVIFTIVVGGSLLMDEPARIRWALAGGAVWVVCLGVGWLIGMGFGDVKAGGVMGLYLGWLAPDGLQAVGLVLYALMIGVLLASVYGIVDRIVYTVRVPIEERRSRPRRWFALGPFLVAGALTVVFVYPSLTTLTI